MEQRAFDLIVRFESGGRAYYDSRACRPTWPGEQSGLTIGMGWDLGYHDADEFARVWSPYLHPEDFERLQSAVGLRGADEAERIRAIARACADIRVPWDFALRVLREDTLPKYEELTRRTFRCADLPPVCEGVLVSLVFNRGSGMEGDRRREMRAIRTALENGRPEDVPAQLRSMCRLWPTSPPPSGLQGRRMDEADLFETGLRERTAAVVTTAAAAPTVGGWFRRLFRK